MTRIVSVEYLVPVRCEVDIDEGTILRVVQDSDDIKQSGYITAEDEGYLDAAETVKAFKIAEDTDWPAWDR